MVKKSRPKKKKLTVRVLLHYIFLWPAFRTYYSMWVGYRHKKKVKRKEKVVIIQE